MADKSKKVPVENPNPDWQDNDIRIPGLVLSVAVALVTTAITFVGVKIMVDVYKRHDAKAGENVVSPLARDRALPSGPRLQVFPRDELAEHLKTEQDRVSHYGWIDPEQGLAKIPINRAVDIVAQQGVPVFQPVPGTAQAEAGVSE